MEAVLFSLFVAFLWALNIIINKYSMNQNINQKTVFVLAAFTYFICTFIFAIYHYESISTDIVNSNISIILLIVIGSIIGIFSGNLLFTYLLEKHNSSVVTTLAYTTPLFVLIMSFLLLKEKPKLLGIFVTVIGVLLISRDF